MSKDSSNALATLLCIGFTIVTADHLAALAANLIQAECVLNVYRHNRVEGLFVVVAPVADCDKVAKYITGEAMKLSDASQQDAA